MRSVALWILPFCLAGSRAFSQGPGTIEVGFFGSASDVVTSQSSLSKAALVTVFMTRRLALETEQDLSGLGRRSFTGTSMWAAYAVPVARGLRLHAGPGVKLKKTDGLRPRVEPGFVVGARWTTYDWLGIRVDGQFAPSPRVVDQSARARPGVTGALYAGFSIRVRG